MLLFPGSKVIAQANAKTHKYDSLERVMGRNSHDFNALCLAPDMWYSIYTNVGVAEAILATDGEYVLCSLLRGYVYGKSEKVI